MIGVSEIVSKVKFLKEELNYECTFNKVAQPEEIELFQKKYDLLLPADYKDFLLEVGNGGSFGLRPLDFHHYLTETNDVCLTKEFPLSKPYQGEVEAVALDDSIYDGQLIIEADGCGNYTFLVVNGSEFGHVWWNEIPSNDELIPFTGFDWDNRIKPNVRKSFSEWYYELLELNSRQMIERNKLKIS